MRRKKDSLEGPPCQVASKRGADSSGKLQMVQKHNGQIPGWGCIQISHNACIKTAALAAVYSWAQFKVLRLLLKALNGSGPECLKDCLLLYRPFGVLRSLW